jgi:hypothetical protein
MRDALQRSASGRHRRLALLGCVAIAAGCAAAAPEESRVACTMDARQCPDGSFVGRIPPSCEFAPCPDGGAQ